MSSYLLSGSFAYDTILLHEGELQHRILPESLSKLNVAFGIDHVENEFGGTGGNIGYNSALLGDQPLLIGTLGKRDCEDYLNHLSKSGLDSTSLTLIEGQYCAHAWLLTDKKNNQITSFSGGSMKHMPVVPQTTPDIWHLSPENPITMAKLALQAQNSGKEYFFDPGQVLPYFLQGAAEKVNPLTNIVKNSKGLFVNEYEAELLVKHIGMPLEELAVINSVFIVRTLGGAGLDLITGEGLTHVPVAKTDRITDPTGCGDAFRAGFLYAYTRNMPLEYCAQLGATMGAFAIETSGGQNHNPTKEQINQRLFESFGVILQQKAKSSLRV